MVWSAPQVGREDIAGYCTTLASDVIIMATWGGVEQRVGVVKVAGEITYILWSQIGPSGVSASRDGPESISKWQLIAPEPCPWNLAALFHFAFVRLQTLEQRRPKCKCILDGLANVMLTLVVPWTVIWSMLLFVQWGVVELICFMMPGQIDQAFRDETHWHAEQISQLVLLVLFTILYPVNFPSIFGVNCLRGCLIGLVMISVTWKHEVPAPMCFRVAYGAALGLALVAFALRCLLRWWQGAYVDETDPLTWPGVVAVDEVDRPGVIHTFLQQAANNLTPEMMLRRSVEGLLYDSVTGLDSESGGVLRKIEYVIFNSSQAVPKYIFRVSETPARVSSIDVAPQTYGASNA